MFLSPDELRQLTGRRRSDAQARVLRFMGVDHKVRPDGSIAVLSEHVKKVLDSSVANANLREEAEPNWDKI
jgi:hypothetical protein